MGLYSPIMKKTLQVLALPLGVALFVCTWVVLFAGAGCLALCGIQPKSAS